MYVCFIGLDMEFDRLPRKVLEWVMKKKGMPEVLVRSVMRLCEVARTRVRVYSDWSELSQVFAFEVEMHHCVFLLSAVGVDFVSDLAREGAACKANVRPASLYGSEAW